jgi:hypothetical protein
MINRSQAKVASHSFFFIVQVIPLGRVNQGSLPLSRLCVRVLATNRNLRLVV